MTQPRCINNKNRCAHAGAFAGADGSADHDASKCAYAGPHLVPGAEYGGDLGSSAAHFFGRLGL